MRNSRKTSSFRLPKVSTVVACLALFIAIGGSAYAAKDLLTGKDIAKNTLTGKNVKNGSLKKADLNKKAVASLQGAKGAKGEKGDQGANGEQGPQGIQGVPGTNGVVTPQEARDDNPEPVTNGTEEVVLSKTVPAGAYAVTAEADSFSVGTGIGGCGLAAGATSLDDAVFNSAAGSRIPVSLLGVTPAGTTQITVSCNAGATDISISEVSLVAIPVG